MVSSSFSFQYIGDFSLLQKQLQPEGSRTDKGEGYFLLLLLLAEATVSKVSVVCIAWECAGDCEDSRGGTRMGIWSSLAQHNKVIKNVLKCRKPPNCKVYHSRCQISIFLLLFNNATISLIYRRNWMHGLQPVGWTYVAHWTGHLAGSD